MVAATSDLDFLPKLFIGAFDVPDFVQELVWVNYRTHPVFTSMHTGSAKAMSRNVVANVPLMPELALIWPLNSQNAPLTNHNISKWLQGLP